MFERFSCSNIRVRLFSKAVGKQKIQIDGGMI
jgi:hypothetical protein